METEQTPPDWPSWTWDRSANRLVVDVAGREDLVDLDGDWSFDAVRHLVDGLSASRMAHAFLEARSGGPGDIINCAVSLRYGRRVQFVGGYTGEGMARGIILTEAQETQDVSTSKAGYESVDESVPPKDHLEPRYQPIFNARTGAISGFEALARWKGGRSIDPRSFEMEGLLSNMLIHAAELAARLQKSIGEKAPFLSVNLSARDLSDPGLVALLEGVISSHGLRAGALVAELTEHDALRSTSEAHAQATKLDQIGVSLMLDDFGAGQSSFLWLIDLPVTGVKLDGELIAKRTQAKGDATIRSLVALARELGLSTIAEGVEAGGEAEALAAMGIENIQGFALGRPVPADEAAALALR